MLIGHSKQRHFLKKTAELNRLSHAYLFCGQEKLGKKKIALEMLSILFKQKNLLKIQHPDFLLIEPQAKEIQVFQIKELIQKLSFKSSLGPFKAAIINDAHLMNQEAQTCLLKTLEEPKGETVLILISHKKHYLFPAILSRVQMINFNPVKKEDIRDCLLKNGLSSGKADEISEISLGRPGMAFEIAFKEQGAEIFKNIDKIINSPFYFRFQCAKALSEDSWKTKETLEFWILYFRIKLMSALKKRQATLGIRKALKLFEKTNFLVSTTNVNPKLALEALMLDI
jgi:DNA polymerase III subunit delta'